MRANADQPVRDSGEGLFEDELNRVCDDVVTLGGSLSGKGSSSNEKELKANRNISSIIERIQDEGSAFSDSKNDNKRRAEARVKARVKAFRNVSGNSDEKKVSEVKNVMPLKDNTARLNSPSGKDYQEKSGTDNSVQAGNSNRVLYTATLVIVSALVGVFVLLDQVQQQNLMLQKAIMVIQDEAVVKKPEVNEANTVKSEIAVLNSKVEEISKALTGMAHDSSLKVSMQTNNRDKIKHKKKVDVIEKAAVDNKKPVIDKTEIDNNLVDAVSIEREKVTQIAYSAPTMFAVNLAAFSDRDKAVIQLSRLRKAGYIPAMKKISIKGRQMYRLSIDGFSTHEEARLFSIEIHNKLGLKSWIRQSQGVVNS